MDNSYPPTGDGDPQDARRTDQFWTPAPGSPGHGPHDPAGPHEASGPPPRPGPVERHYTRDRRHKLRWTVGLSLAVVLAAAGVIGGVALASHTPSSSFSQASDNAATPSGSGTSAAAQLNSVLNAASAPGTLTLTSAPAVKDSAARPAVKAAAVARVRACRRAVAALRAARKTGRPALIKKARAAVLAHCRGLRRHLLRFVLLRGIAGQFTIHTKNGIRTLAFERGVIQSVGHGVIVVRAVNGLTEAWHLVGNTVVREHGNKTSASALTTGERVWVGGPVLAGARDARLIVIRPPTASSANKPAPAASSGS